MNLAARRRRRSGPRGLAVHAGGGPLARRRRPGSSGPCRGPRPSPSTNSSSRSSRGPAPVSTGVFGATMEVSLVNDGPATFLARASAEVGAALAAALAFDGRPSTVNETARARNRAGRRRCRRAPRASGRSRAARRRPRIGGWRNPMKSATNAEKTSQTGGPRNEPATARATAAPAANGWRRPSSGAQDVGSVELPEREEVHRGDEQAEPGGHEGRMLVDGGARVRTECIQPWAQRTIERVVEEGRAGGQGRRARARVRHAVEKKREGRDEPRDRPGRTDVEQRALVRDRLLDADDGAEGSEGEHVRQQDGRRQKDRQRRREAVAPAHDVVAELVDAEDHHDRNRECEAVREPTTAEPAARRRESRSAGERRRDEGQHEQGEVEKGMLGGAPPARQGGWRFGKRLGRGIGQGVSSRGRICGAP